MHNGIDVFRLECGFEMRKPAPYSTFEHLRALVSLHIWCSKSVCRGQMFANESDTLQISAGNF